MPEIMTAPEAEKKARDCLKALKDMPQDSPDRKGYEDDLNELLKVKVYGLKETLERELQEAGFLTESEEETALGTEAQAEEPADSEEVSHLFFPLLPEGKTEGGEDETEGAGKPEPEAPTENQYVKMLVAGLVKVLNFLNAPVFGEKKTNNGN